MQKNGQLAIALALIVIGALFLMANLMNFDVGRIFWPTVLVMAGLVLILRPVSLEKTFKPFGLERFGAWEPGDAEYAMFVGEIDLDFGQATLKDGVTKLGVKAFVADTELRIPAEIGVRLMTSAFVTDSNINGDKMDHIFSGVSHKSENYDAAPKKLDVDLTGFVVSLKLRHG
ncbi:MAG: hypothetical protein HYZ26_10560 [Chloroflexi bacterium]|nr:hypothetical protein [Chloroflexota bacterium]